MRVKYICHSEEDVLCLHKIDYFREDAEILIKS